MRVHFSLKWVVLQNFSLASSVMVFSWHQNEPKPAMSLSAQAGGGADGGGLGRAWPMGWARAAHLGGELGPARR